MVLTGLLSQQRIASVCPWVAWPAHLSGCARPEFIQYIPRHMWILTHLQMSTEDERQTKRRPFSLPAVKRRQGHARGAARTLSQIGE